MAKLNKKPKWAPDAEQPVTSFDVGYDSQWRIGLAQQTNKPAYVTIRRWYKLANSDAQAGEWRPRSGGVVINFENLPDLINGLSQALLTLEEQNWQVLRDKHA